MRPDIGQRLNFPSLIITQKSMLVKSSLIIMRSFTIRPIYHALIETVEPWPSHYSIFPRNQQLATPSTAPDKGVRAISVCAESTTNMHRGLLFCSLQLNQVWNNLISVTLINWNLSCVCVFPWSMFDRAYVQFLHPLSFLRIKRRRTSKEKSLIKPGNHQVGYSRLQPADGRRWRQLRQRSGVTT